jgi:hypothetical protein
MGERYIKTVAEHLGKVVASHQRDWKFLLAYTASPHDTTSMTLVLGRELRLLAICCLGYPPYKERPTIHHAANLVGHLHEIHNYAQRHPKLGNNRMKTLYDRLANCAGYQKGHKLCSLPNPREGEIAQPPILMGGPVRSSHRNKWYTGSSGTLGRSSWCYAWTDWHLIKEPIGTSGLKEGAAGAVGE